MFDDSGNLLNKGELAKLNKQQTADEATLKKLKAGLAKTKNPKTQATLQARIDALEPKIATRAEEITTLSDPNYAANRIKGAFSEQYDRRDKLVSDMDAARAPTSEYTRMQDAFGRGITAQTLGQRSASLAQANAAGMGQVADVRAGQVGAGALGGTLMERALEMARSDGRMNANATRDAIQAARQGMAARGMATGGAGLAAELLNRDRYANQRMFQDLAFSQGIQDQDLTRQRFNMDRTLEGDMANQQTQFGREQIISANQQATNVANMQAANNMNQFNTELGATTDFRNAQFADETNRYNMGLLESSALRAGEEQNRNLALGTDIYNFTTATDPKLIAAGIGSPYASLTGSTEAAANVVGTVTANPQYTGGNFSGGGGTDWLGLAATGVSAGADIYKASQASDRRMKKDIKQVGGKDALGLKTYQFRYKGEPDNAPKRVGYMAQDVKKVLPQAVETFNHNGEKRMAIKPRVIGQALSEALAEQQRGMFAKGYRVGAGL